MIAAMKETYIKSDYRAHLELLKPQGFTLNSDEIFEKTINNGKIILYIEADEYFPHSVVFGQVMIEIRFTNVETLFKQACNNTSNAVYSADEDDLTFGRGFAEDIIGEAGFDTLYENEVEDDFSFQIVRPLLEQMRDAALAWADQNDTLQKAYDNAEALTLDVRSNLYSQPFPNKYLIIKKLLNKTDFQDYFDELIDFYTNDEPDTNEVLFLNAQKTILDAL